MVTIPTLPILPMLEWLPYIALILPLVFGIIFGMIIGWKREMYFLIWNIISYGGSLLAFYLLSTDQVYEMLQILLPSEVYQFFSELRNVDQINIEASVGVIFTIAVIVILDIIAFAIYLPLHFTVWRKLSSKGFGGRAIGGAIGLITAFPLAIFLTDASLLFAPTFPISSIISDIAAQVSINQFVYQAVGETNTSAINWTAIGLPADAESNFAVADGTYNGMTRLTLLFDEINSILSNVNVS